MSSLKIKEYDLYEDWAGNVVDKIIGTEDKGSFRLNAKKNDIKVNGTRLNSSQCIRIEWSICDYINGVTSNCEFVGTTTIGCNQEFEPPGDGGGGEDFDRTTLLWLDSRPHILGNDTTKARAFAYVHGSYGWFDDSHFEGVDKIKMPSSYTYNHEYGSATYSNYQGHLLTFSFLGDFIIDANTSASVGGTLTYTYAEAFGL